MIRTAYNYIDKERDINNAMAVVDDIARKNNTKPEIIALQVVKENIPTINRYVVEHGEVPEKNPIALAAQATLLHEQKIWDKIENDGIPDYKAAERQVLAEEQMREDLGEIDSFIGSILGIVFKAGAKALPKINQKRVAAGKRPLLAGEKGRRLFDKVNAHVQLEAELDNRNGGGSGSSKYSNSTLGILTGALADEVEAEKTREAIKRYLPFIVIAIIAIIYLARKAK